MTELGISWIASRKGNDGELLPATMAVPESEWSVFISREEDVGSVATWMYTVCDRLNEDGIAADTTLFKYKVAFTVTSFGSPQKQGRVKKFQEMVTDADAVDIVVGIHDLNNPHNRGKAMDSIDSTQYFETQKIGIDLVTDHFNSMLEND